MLGRDEMGGVYKLAMKHDIYPVSWNESGRCRFLLKLKLGGESHYPGRCHQMYSVRLTKRQPVVIWAGLWLPTLPERKPHPSETHRTRLVRLVRLTQKSLVSVLPWLRTSSLSEKSFRKQKWSESSSLVVRTILNSRPSCLPSAGQVPPLWLTCYFNPQQWFLSQTTGPWSKYTVWACILFSSMLSTVSHWMYRVQVRGAGGQTPWGCFPEQAPPFLFLFFSPGCSCV